MRCGDDGPRCGSQTEYEVRGVGRGQVQEEEAGRDRRKGVQEYRREYRST